MFNWVLNVPLASVKSLFFCCYSFWFLANRIIWLKYFKPSFFLKKEIIIAKEPNSRNLPVQIFWFKREKSVFRKYVSSYDQILKSNARAKHGLLWVSEGSYDAIRGSMWLSGSSIGLSSTQWGQLGAVGTHWGLVKLSGGQWGLMGVSGSQRGSLVLSGQSVELSGGHWGSMEINETLRELFGHSGGC